VLRGKAKVISNGVIVLLRDEVLHLLALSNSPSTFARVFLLLLVGL